MRKSFQSLLLLLLGISTSWQTVRAAEPVIGYGSSLHIINQRVQEGFFSGFQLGFTQVFPHDRMKSLLKVEQDRDGGALGAVLSAQKLVRSGVVGLFGFPGSADALLASRVAKENGLLFIAPGCNHNDLGKFGPHVLTTGHSSDDEAAANLKFVKHLKFRRILIVVDPLAAPSAAMEEIYRDTFRTTPFLSLTGEIVRMENDRTLAKPVIEKLKSGTYDTMILTSYPEASTAVVDQMIQNEIDLPLVADLSWGNLNSEIMRPFMAFKKTPIYMGTSWYSDLPEATRFKERFRQVYAMDANAEGALGYDLGVIVGTILKRTNGKYTKESLIEAFQKNRCFDGLSSERLCFSSQGGHAKRSIYFLKFTPTGFKPVYTSRP